MFGTRKWSAATVRLNAAVHVVVLTGSGARRLVRSQYAGSKTLFDLFSQPLNDASRKDCSGTGTGCHCPVAFVVRRDERHEDCVTDLTRLTIGGPAPPESHSIDLEV